jgi:hypothetical protein
MEAIVSLRIPYLRRTSARFATSIGRRFARRWARREANRLLEEQLLDLEARA